MNLSIEEKTGEEALKQSWGQKLRPMYRRAYDVAPYHYTDSDADEFVSRFESQAPRDGFRLLVGRVNNDVAGFAYGYTFPDNLWWRGARKDASTTLVLASKYAVIELVVDPAFQGNFFARKLLNGLLAGRTEQVATLLAKPGALAHAMYQRWGWVKVGEVQSYPHWPVDDAFLFPLAEPAVENLLER